MGGEKEGEGGQNGGKREEGRRQERTGRRGSRKEAPKTGVIFCIWPAGRRIRWRVLGLIIKSAEIGCLCANRKMGMEVGRQEVGKRPGGGRAHGWPVGAGSGGAKRGC